MRLGLNYLYTRKKGTQWRIRVGWRIRAFHREALVTREVLRIMTEGDRKK